MIAVAPAPAGCLLSPERPAEPASQFQKRSRSFFVEGGDGIRVPGGGLTVSVAELLVALPNALVTTQRYWPAFFGAVELNVNVAVVAPDTGPPLETFAQ